MPEKDSPEFSLRATDPVDRATPVPATSLALGNAGYTAERMDTSAEVTLEQVEGGFAITGIKLVMRARVPNIEDRQFRELAEAAKASCPLSKALAAVPITLDAELV